MAVARLAGLVLLAAVFLCFFFERAPTRRPVVSAGIQLRRSRSLVPCIRNHESAGHMVVCVVTDQMVVVSDNLSRCLHCGRSTRWLVLLPDGCDVAASFRMGPNSQRDKLTWTVWSCTSDTMCKRSSVLLQRLQRRESRSQCAFPAKWQEQELGTHLA